MNVSMGVSGTFGLQSTGDSFIFRMCVFPPFRDAKSVFKHFSHFLILHLPRQLFSVLSHFALKSQVMLPYHLPLIC